ncbi:hypothetical protein BDN72DRAFT_562515 [Pluteus cervinus]|uniref:Uncharacterized protein n=1 Tax=Pluteus cervinus TaxID=181527 RepID=A0ACD3BBH6_9AGAR|nr:hypothetical protein BDN72DRAFT_562515 [Pluteus cervinus]
MHDNDPEILEVEKRRNLYGIQHRTSTPLRSAPGWNEPLATASEANVKADKCTVTMSEMQERTVEYVKGRHNPDERIESTTASYTKDEVEGPLSGRGNEALAQSHESGTVHKDVEHHANPTASEEAVKADRGEVESEPRNLNA